MSEDQPPAEEENEFIRRHGINEYGKWHLGIDDEEDEENKRAGKTGRTGKTGGMSS
jgi:hypothetical protein